LMSLLAPGGSAGLLFKISDSSAATENGSTDPATGLVSALRNDAVPPARCEHPTETELVPGVTSAMPLGGSWWMTNFNAFAGVTGDQFGSVKTEALAGSADQFVVVRVLLVLLKTWAKAVPSLTRKPAHWFVVHAAPESVALFVVNVVDVDDVKPCSVRV